MKKDNTKKRSHSAADALDWDEAMRVVNALYRDGRYRDCLLISIGCHLGLRISDIRLLTWGQLCSPERMITLNETKTGKSRTLKVSDRLFRLCCDCRVKMGSPDDGLMVFRSSHFGGERPITRQCVAQLFDDIKKTYHVRTARTFSTHSLRKTFGRRVWQMECARNRGDQALLLLCDVFGHASTAITKRYLGIRQEEILSVYDSLEEEL